MKSDKKYMSLPFWSWNDRLDADELVKQVEWMNENGIGGFFMHARGGLKTEYLGEEWFKCIDACAKRAEELGMHAYAYDENGWPSGFVGGKLLEDMENRDRYLTFAFGKYDGDAYVSYGIRGDELCRIKEGFDGECLNIYHHYATSTADILNPEVVDKFIELTHREYEKRDTYSLKGFFTDEPQYQRWGIPYTKMLAPYFKEHYGEDILDRLGLLITEKKGYRDFRYKYWRAMQELMLNNFAKKVYEWCDKRGYKLTGHYIEENCLNGQMSCCAGIMPFYEYEHIPGIDYLGNYIETELSPKQVSSVAAQLGKSQIITETYACCGWNITPAELKLIAEGQYVGGVNLMCQHLLPYKEGGQRKRDYPAHYSPINPWVNKNFKEFNRYFTVLGKILTDSAECVNVGVLHPIRSAYFDYKPHNHEDWNGLGKLQRGLIRLLESLTKRAIPHHLLDETVMAKHAYVDGDRLIVGKCSYDYVILPKIYTMDRSTKELLSTYVSNGGKVLLFDGAPTYLEGEEYCYDFLNSNTSLDEIAAAQPLCTDDARNVRSAYRRAADGREFIYAVNMGEAADVDFKIKNGTSFESYDIMKDEYTCIGTRVHFEKGQSCVLYLSNKTPTVPKSLPEITLPREFTVTGKADNYLTIDKIRYSKDGKLYSEPLHHMGVFNELLKERYSGKLWLKYEFYAKCAPSECELLIEYASPVFVEINGERVDYSGKTYLNGMTYAYSIGDMVKDGANEITIALDYFQSEAVYYALFGENVTESLKNCLAYDTEIEAVYLKGSFGVYGNMEGCSNESVIMGDDFYLGEQKTKISSLVNDGYPFFNGDIALKCDIYSETGEGVIKIDGKFHIIDVYVNKKYAGRMMFEPTLDISPYLKVGNNEIELTLTVGIRNLLGPFHDPELEPRWVSPDTFERLGTWKDGHSSRYVEKYAFVKSILDI